MAQALVEVLLLGALAGTVGVFVVIRRLAFVSDALTHTVFPGVVIGYLLAGDTGIFAGALVAGAATAVALTLLTRGRRLSEDAAVAVILTSMFSVGVALVSHRSSYTSDLTAFLFGRLLTVSVTEIVQTAVVAALVFGTLLVVGKELVFRAFDPQGAQAQGFRVGLLDLVLNVLIALVVVAAVHAVGTVLVIALLIVPAAAARFVTHRLVLIGVIAAAIGMVGGWLGLVVSWNASIHAGARLGSGATVVVVIVAIYAALLTATAVIRRVRRRKAGQQRPSVEPPLVGAQQ
ncbi:MAG: metal ABC transporter permease [Streptosporangiales bacterium]|nr:metal ABC transporter permease [Streptosporangiales bacterium]